MGSVHSEPMRLWPGRSRMGSEYGTHGTQQSVIINGMPLFDSPIEIGS
jgi:hypothetical protein